MSERKIKIPPDLKLEIERIIDEKVRAIYAGVPNELAELRKAVLKLAEAQVKTEERLNSFAKATEENFKRIWESINQLTIRVDQLAEAQIKIEERLNQLTLRVDQLAEAQIKTEERLNQLTLRVVQLAEAQIKTEERLNQLTIRVDQLTERLEQLTIRVDQLAEAQRKNEERLNQLIIRVDQLTERLEQLTIRVDQLAEAQRKTEERLNQLTIRVDQLAEAQRKTEEQLGMLIQEFRQMRKQFGDLSDAIGYGLEDRAFKALPELLERDYGIKVETKLKRTFIKDREGNEIEVNIFGFAKRNGEEIVIIGEAKSQLSKNKVDDFIKRKLSKISLVYEKVFPVLITYMISESDVEEYVKEKGIALYYSYDL